MSSQGRLGDKAQCPSDSHGCPSCAHPVVGPAIAGSPNVFVNGKSALRVNDPGVHAGCCGPNTWNAAKGAPGVFFNSIAAHRKEDPTKHCGGNGKLIEGSQNVFVGDFASSATVVESSLYDRYFLVVFEGTSEPAPNRRYRITREDGRVVAGRTDEQGRTVLVPSDHAEELKLEVLES
ncbi:MAG: hypothetical protein HUU55_22140 [Myxococcales bacterium]|nr:hypothetical protein [Myxococcales bacterium]